MNGYKHVFDKAVGAFAVDKRISEDIFSSFRSESVLYGFIDNGDRPMDAEADQIAQATSPDLYKMYRGFLRTRKQLGYGSVAPVHADYSNLDSRHIMMFTLLFSRIQGPLNTIVEIGGGFGNWLTLNQHLPFHKWTIVDLPHLTQLQNWFLQNQGIDSTRYELVSAFDYTALAAQPSFDLVIGSHSVSEFSFDVFYAYFTKIISKAKYFFYCYHNTMPSPVLIQTKLDIIGTKFELIGKTLSEKGQVSNCLFKLKS
jgi:hypothetical protein